MDMQSCSGKEATVNMFGNIAEQIHCHTFTGHVVRSGLGRHVICLCC